MNKFLKNPAKTDAKMSATDPKNESPKQNESMQRILTVDIKMMKIHMRNDNFNNQNTILELFARISGIAEGGRKMNHLTLRSLDSFHMSQALYCGDVQKIQKGDVVRCVGQLMSQTGQFKIFKMTKVDWSLESTLNKRLIAFSNFELAKLPIKSKK